MTRLDDAVVAALRATADDAAQAVDTVRARAAVEARLDRVDGWHRRRRMWLVPVAIGAVAAAAVVVVLTGRALRQAEPAQPTHPSPTSTWLTLANDPFLPDGVLGGLARDPNAQTRPLSSCLTDPRGWGAVQSKAATYDSPSDPTVTVNEFVLRFTDPASAHRAVLDAWGQLASCPYHFHGSLGPPGTNQNEPFLKDIVDGQSSDHGGYAPRLARAGNVVVVLENTGALDLRSYAILGRAMGQASPQYSGFGPKAWP